MSVIAVASGKGSPGATFVAVNIAAAMARRGSEVLLLDLDAFGGDVCAYLKLDPRRGLYPLLRMEGGIPGSDRIIQEAEERDGFLAVCGVPEPSDVASPEAFVAALRGGRATGRTVVADLGRVTASTVSIAAEADVVLLTVRPDLVSVLGADRALRILDVSVPRERVALVLSGLERRRPGDRAEVADALGVPIAAALPPDAHGARKALLAQAPATTPRLRRAFDSLAAEIAEGATAAGVVPQPVGVAEPLEVSS
jgi:MinD-like ATPase involved in chromosome partitioning or flagellar assembly